MAKTPVEIRLKVLAAIDYAPGDTIVARIRYVANQAHIDTRTNTTYRFTWRTISTWVYRFKVHGITTLENKTRSDKNAYRKVSVSQLAEAIHDVLPQLSRNKVGILPKSVVYRVLLQKNLFTRSQLAPTTFYRMVRTHQLLQEEHIKKHRLSFAMQYVNELWQADTMHGPSIKQANGSWKKTFLIAFIDDASRVITHAQFFYSDNTINMIDAFRSALFKRGKPERLYFDNGANYTSKEILQACLRMDIHLSHAPIRDGAAKGKIERFFKGFRDRFLTQHRSFTSLEQLNQLTHLWVENDYNNHYHSGIQMTPIDRFNLDRKRVKFLADDAYSREIFYVEEERSVSKTNLIHINNERYECPVDLRDKKVHVRYDRNTRANYIVYFDGQRMGEATKLDLYLNAYSARSAD